MILNTSKTRWWVLLRLLVIVNRVHQLSCSLSLLQCEEPIRTLNLRACSAVQFDYSQERVNCFWSVMGLLCKPTVTYNVTVGTDSQMHSHKPGGLTRDRIDRILRKDGDLLTFSPLYGSNLHKHCVMFFSWCNLMESFPVVNLQIVWSPNGWSLWYHQGRFLAQTPANLICQQWDMKCEQNCHDYDLSKPRIVFDMNETE